MMNYKIAISGNHGSGKNTVSKFISKNFLSHYYHVFNKQYQARHNYDIADFTHKEIAFADPIKQSLKLYFPKINDKDLFGDSDARSTIINSAYKDNNPVTIRQLLRNIGEGMKLYNKDIWINCFDDTLNMYKHYHLILNTDLRFIDEFNYLKQNDFKLIRIIRTSQTDAHTHVSETEQYKIPNDDFDFVIYNDGSLDDLKNKCKDLCDKLLLI